MNMPKVSGQYGQATLRVLVSVIPVQQSLRGKSMPEIMQTRPMTRGGAAQTNLPRQCIEGTAYLPAIQPIASLGYEQVGCRASIEESFTTQYVVSEHFPG